MDHEEVHPVATDASGPTIGETTEGLGRYLVENAALPNIEGFVRIRRDALEIIRHSKPFTPVDGSRTGLVVGYVQSGKTLSMVAVSALARDNGCRVIVLLAGVTTNLLQQNASRFTKILRGASGRAVWRIFNSQDGLANAGEQLAKAIQEWNDPAFSDDRQTLLFLVLKHHVHLEKLTALLAQNNLKGVPALVLDDEADQAGLNTKPDDPGGSMTYQKIAQLRRALPNHTYLQYTATPQAPLLIALDDMLSPAFAELVEPGDAYTGGKVFFGPGAQHQHVKSIPGDDLFKAGNPPNEPPDSLLEALRVFFLGCAVASMRGWGSPRSMLVHPSPRMSDHSRYLEWIRSIIDRWSTNLRSGEADERTEALEEFRNAHAELSKTDDALPPLEDTVRRLQISLSRVSLKEVNSQDGSEVDWDNADDHILVGGEKLNRGFTVEGLRVTYMPREAGDWNADTIQQRARFFGYKAKYLSLCRIYLHPDLVHAFRAYVRHEEAVRDQLSNHRGRPLREWRRAFFLDARMRPTRSNVLSDPYYRIPKDRTWFVQRHPHDSKDAWAHNAGLLEAFAKRQTFKSEPGYFNHEVTDVSLGEFYKDVLLTFQAREGDRPGWYGQLVIIADILEEDPEARMVFVRMANIRKRTPTDKGEVVLHQGRTSKDDQPDGYPGDAKICDSTIVTAQFHRLNVESHGELPALAIHVPKRLRKDDLIAAAHQP